MKMNNSQLQPIGSASSLAVTQNRRMKQKDEEADRLAIAAQNGDLTARDELYIRCQPLINWAVKRAKQRFPGFDFDDLRQEYYLIFEKCIRRYKSGGGTFKLYLVKAFQNNTPRLYLKNRTIPIKNTLLTYQYLKKIGGHVPTFDSISQKANAKFEKERERVETTRPEDVALQHEREEIVADMIRYLHERYRTVIQRLYALNTYPKTLDKIGEEDGISRERARHLRDGGLALLKKVILHFYKQEDVI